MPVMRRAVIAACLLGVASAATWQGRDLGTTEVDEAALNVDRTVSGLKCEVAGAIVSALLADALESRVLNVDELAIAARAF
jgi:hypothetical protein